MVRTLRKQLMLLPLALACLAGCRGPVALRVKDAPTLAPTARTAPDFSAMDHTGKAVSLRAALADGPVVLVFYRGHW